MCKPFLLRWHLNHVASLVQHSVQWAERRGGEGLDVALKWAGRKGPRERRTLRASPSLMGAGGWVVEWPVKRSEGGGQSKTAERDFSALGWAEVSESHQGR